MILAATTVCSVDPVSQSAILGYHQSALVCILHCSIRFRGQDEKATSNRNCCVADGNLLHRQIGGIGERTLRRWAPRVHLTRVSAYSTVGSKETNEVKNITTQAAQAMTASARRM